MNRFQSSGTERVTAAWIIAGLSLVVLVGLSMTIELPAEPVALAEVAREPATEVMYDPDEADVLALQERYAELVVPASFEDDGVRTGVAP